jgi:uncharacterized protein YjcR
MLDRIEALTEQLKTVLDREAATTARYDAKLETLTEQLEALTAKVKLMDDLDVINGEKIEALTKERDEAMQLLQTLSNMNGDLSRDMYKTKLLLAKAVEALRVIEADCEADYPPSHLAIRYAARATLAEIEGEQA